MKVTIPEGMIHIVSQEEKRKRDIALGKVRPAPAKPLPTILPAAKPVVPPAAPVAQKAPRRDRRKQVGQQFPPEVAALMEKQCAQILEVVCDVIGCSAFCVRESGSLAEEVRARRITAHIALVHVEPRIPYSIIATATGLKNGTSIYQSEREFKLRVQYSEPVRTMVEYILAKLQERNTLKRQP